MSIVVFGTTFQKVPLAKLRYGPSDKCVKLFEIRLSVYNNIIG